MKKITTLILISFLTISCSMAQKTSFSEETLALNLINPENKEVVFKEILEKHKGKTTIIEFWASWCSDCVKAMPKIKELQSSFPEVDFVFVSLDKNFEKFKNGVAKHVLKGDNFWVNDTDGMKGKFGQSIDLDWIPRYIIIDKKGNIAVYKAIETDFEKITETLKNLN